MGLAPNMIWAVDEEGYRLTRKLADEEHVLITTHVAETNFELETAAALTGCNQGATGAYGGAEGTFIFVPPRTTNLGVRSSTLFGCATLLLTNHRFAAIHPKGEWPFLFVSPFP